jgi:beta-glucosidase
VQVYAGLPGSKVARAPRALVGFAKVEISAGATAEVEVVTRREDLAYWETRTGSWAVEGGTYRLDIGASSRDIRSTVEVGIDGDEVRIPLTIESSIGEVMAHPVAGAIVMQALASSPSASLAADPAMFKMMASFPIGRLIGFPGMGISPEQLDQLLAAANGRV